MTVSCASSKKKAQPAAEVVKPLESIIIMPVEQLLVDRHKDVGDMTELDEGILIMEELLHEYFADHPTTRMISESQKEGLAQDFAGSRMALAREIGRKLSSDGVMVVTLNRFIKREGTQRALAGNAASVAFDFRLIRTDTGETLCAGVFDETQHAVFDNLFSFSSAMRRGFKWITARELAKEGIQEKLGNCLYLQKIN